MIDTRPGDLLVATRTHLAEHRINPGDVVLVLSAELHDHESCIRVLAAGAVVKSWFSARTIGGKWCPA